MHKEVHFYITKCICPGAYSTQKNFFWRSSIFQRFPKTTQKPKNPNRNKKTMPYLLILPYPPSINNYYGHTSKPFPHQYIKPPGRAYRTKIKELISEQNLILKSNIPLKVQIQITPPDNRTRDIDNIFKCLIANDIYIFDIS